MTRAVAVVVALAALVRLAASWNDLWLDEVWTIALIGGLRSPLEVVTALHHDNNHVLNTLVLYALRPLGTDWLYRLPAVLAGIATVVLAAELAAAGGALGAASPAARRLVGALVAGASHPLVHFGSEARGYAYALAFGLGAVLVAVRDGVRPRSPRAPLCWLLLVLAVLGHALALHLAVALGAWALVRVLGRDRLAPALATLAWWLLVPAAAYALFYLGFLRHLAVGGGPRGAIEGPLRHVLAVTSGLPLDAPLALLLAVVLGVTLLAAWVHARAGADLWVLFTAGIVASPLVLALLHPSDLYAARHFLVSATLWLVFAARLAGWLAGRGAAGAAAAAVLLAAFAVANGTRVAALLADGRGSYRAALELMAARTPGPVVEVGSDHDFRNRLLVEHYGPRVAKPVRYRRATEGSPPWYLAHRTSGGAPPAPEIPLARGTYRLVEAYPTAMLSGFNWYVYARAAGPGR